MLLFAGPACRVEQGQHVHRPPDHPGCGLTTLQTSVYLAVISRTVAIDLEDVAQNGVPASLDGHLIRSARIASREHADERNDTQHHQHCHARALKQCDEQARKRRHVCSGFQGLRHLAYLSQHLLAGWTASDGESNTAHLSRQWHAYIYVLICRCSFLGITQVLQCPSKAQDHMFA
jgi:hypothetical protein